MAQIRATLTQDVDQPARAPFQASVTVNINNFTFTNVPIPAGKRLVIDYISMSGAAQTSGQGQYVQPIVLFNTTVAGNPGATYYFGPNPSTTAPGQYYADYHPIIYADSLAVGPAFAGYTPSFDTFEVNISGHLITP